MASSRKNYVILSEVLRKIDIDENYEPTDHEHKVVVSLLEREEEECSSNRSKSRNPSNSEW
jgi:hypothetical protein